LGKVQNDEGCCSHTSEAVMNGYGTQWNNSYRKTDVLGRNVLSATLFTAHPKWTVLGLNLNYHGDKMPCKCLTCSTAYMALHYYSYAI